jgi:ATP-binding cassette subfamily B protein
VLPVATTKKSYIDPAKLPKVERATLRRILEHLRPYRGYVALVVVCILCSAVLNLAPSIFIKQIVDRAIPERRLSLLVLLCAGMVVGPLCAGLLVVAQRYYANVVGERMMFDLRVALFRHLQRQPVGYFASRKPGETISHVLNDVQGIGSVLSSTLVTLVDNALILGTTAALVLVLDWRLGLVALALLPLFVPASRRVGETRKRLKRRAQVQLAEITGLLAETLSVSGALMIKLFGAEKHEVRRLRGKAQELLELSLRQNLVGRWFQMLLGVFEAFGPALVFAVGGWLILRGQLQLGTLVAFVPLLKRLYPPATQLAGVRVDVLTSYAYFERVFAVLDVEPTLKNAPDAKRLEAPRGAISFRGVSFSYDGEASALSAIDLEIEPGQSVALVGPSGAGKSTLVGLVPRLYDPTAGAVLIDGQDLRGLKLRSLRSHIGVVTQDTYLFHATIRENLLYARPGASQEELEAATRAAQIHEFIAGLPEGYETVVGERGFRLSGGERQRLAMARALLRDPRILILDEATSSLDAHNEALVQAALEPLLADRTSLVIAHRLSTVRKVDLIVVLEGGRIRERGKHEELLAAGGLYAALYREQLGRAVTTT